MRYEGFDVCVPRPELYTLFKFIVHEQRKNPAKKEKDLDTAQQMTRFLMECLKAFHRRIKPLIAQLHLTAT